MGLKRTHLVNLKKKHLKTLTKNTYLPTNCQLLDGHTREHTSQLISKNYTKWMNSIFEMTLLSVDNPIDGSLALLYSLLPKKFTNQFFCVFDETSVWCNYWQTKAQSYSVWICKLQLKALGTSWKLGNEQTNNLPYYDNMNIG